MQRCTMQAPFTHVSNLKMPLSFHRQGNWGLWRFLWRVLFPATKFIPTRELRVCPYLETESSQGNWLR